MHKVGLKVCEARIGVSTDAEHLLEKDRFYWLDTNFLSIERIPYDEARDSFVRILDKPGAPPMEIRGKTLILKGDFSQLEKEAKDKRYMIFGNLGIFSAWALRTLETAHNIYTFHACAVVKGKELMIISGEAGSGKTIFILSALEKGWKIFSTEFVHFRVGGEVEFFKGPLKDAVRVDTFQRHFPDMAEKLHVRLKEETAGKLVVDFSSFQVEDYVLRNPEITLVFPHIEEERKNIIEKDVAEEEMLLRILFDNVSQKIEESILLYGRIALPGLDALHLAAKRMKNIERFLNRARILRRLFWVSGVGEVMGIV